ncbi:MAG: c-type cytochrome [Gemmatimonadota bacterium]|nr:c-type cytochrome [Gemmatimonadota bacterium]
MPRIAPGIATMAFLLLPAAAGAQENARGKAVYDRWCAGCHGIEGEGDGPAEAYMLPRPRDFTMGLYEIRSTPSGQLPTDADILEVIDEGMPGTAMPGWKDHLSGSDRKALVEVVKSFSRFFEQEGAPEPVEVGSPPEATEEALAEGREFYQKIECWKCHGQAGRGDGPSAPTLEDDRDLPVRAADLTENWLFNGGGSTEAIFARLLTGMNGTPMPSFADLIEADFMTREQLWNVALYVRSLAPEEPPSVRDVIRAGLVEGDLPAAVDDEAWEEVERQYVPLVGQVIVPPRWFAPRVDGVWVQALHDREELVLRLVWHDPSESPDPDWAGWAARVRATMAPDGAEAGSVEGAGAADTAAMEGAEPETGEAVGEGRLAPEATAGAPDRLVVQFPTELPEGMERPYFLMGEEDDPVYLWRWRSDGDASEAIGRGFMNMEPLEGSGDALAAEATFEEGEWRLMIRRSLDAGGVEERLGFVSGRPIPMALFAWDGDNGEAGTRAAIGTWYFLHLDEPSGGGVIVIPLIATLLTAALGVAVVVRAQRREEEREES